MAQLKDLLVTGASRLIDDVFTNKIQVTKIDAPTASNGTTYGPGSSGQVLMSNGTSTYWGGLTTGVSGVKGNAESSYRTGNVNLTPANLGAAPIASPALTGTPTAPTAASGTNNTQIATTAFVYNAFTANDAMVFKGVVNSNSDLPATHYQGWTYKVGTAGTYAGKTCEVGDTVYCVTDGTAANNDHWVVVQANVDAPLYKDGNTFAGNKLLLSDGTGGKVKEGITVGAADLPVYLNNGVPTTITSYKGKAATAGVADSANAVAWGNVSGKPINFKVIDGTALGTTGWLQLGGMSKGTYLTISKPSDTVSWGTNAHSSQLLWGTGDTKGLIDVDYWNPLVSFAGGNINSSTNAAPKWYFKLSGTSEATYTFPTASKTLAATDGTGASGTWGISITGNAATATKLGTATVGSANQPVYLNAGTPTPITWKSLGGSHPTHLYSATSTFTTTTVPTADWWVCITLNRTWDPNLTDIVITASYSNRSGVLYLDCDAHNTLWRAYLTDYGGTNILAIKRVQNSSSKKTEIYLKLAKPTEFNGSTPQGTITIYSPVAIDSITQLTTDPGGLINLRSGYNSNTAITTSDTIYGNLSGNASTATTAINTNYLISNSRMDYGWNGVNYFNISAANQSAAKVNDTPFGSAIWTHILRFNRADNTGYYTDLAVPFNANGIYYKRINRGTLQNSTNNGGWVKVFDNSMTIPIANGGTGATTAANARTNLGLGTMATEIAANYLKLSGGTMTGVLTTLGSQCEDSYSGALNMNNSNIYGLNSIYTCDTSDNASEGIHFYRDATHVDTLWINGGDLLFVPNRALGTGTTKANSQKVGRFTVNPTSGQVVITDGTTGGMKSSGYTIAASVPSGAKFTDTTYPNAIQVYNRASIGTSPNFDNPGVNGLFEIRHSTETTGESGAKPFNGYGSFFSVKTPDNIAMLQLAGNSSNGWYIRGKQSADVTLSGVTWDRLVTNSGTWSISISGNAATATTLQTARTINGTSFNGSANITTANWGTARTLTVGNESVSVNGSTNYSWPHPLKIYYYGSNTASSAGWYKICTVTQSGYSDCNLNLLITSGYSRQAAGLLHVHVRCDNSTANSIKTLKWMYRYGWSAGDVYYKDNGNNTWSLYVNQINTQYGRIQVQILTETGTGDSQQNMAWSNNTTKESAAPTGGTAATDGGIVESATNATYVNIADDTSSKLFVLGATGTGNTRIYRESSVYMQNNVLMGAAWNDYAEYRKPKDNIQIEAGRVVKENGDGTLSLATKRLERGCEIVSDTYGFAIGENDATGTTLPTAATGRVLAYPDADLSTFEIGAPVCSGENGTVSMMTEEEEMRYPSRIIGTVSEIPTYEVWHGGQDVEVKGRIWIRIR